MEQMPLIIFRFFVIKPLGSALEKGLLLFWWGLRALSDSESFLRDIEVPPGGRGKADHLQKSWQDDKIRVRGAKDCGFRLKKDASASALSYFCAGWTVEG
jgi:hypothetical protein